MKKLILLSLLFTTLNSFAQTSERFLKIVHNNDSIVYTYNTGDPRININGLVMTKLKLVSKQLDFDKDSAHRYEFYESNHQGIYYEIFYFGYNPSVNFLITKNSKLASYNDPSYYWKFPDDVDELNVKNIKSDINIYPNPTNGILNVNSENDYQLTDMIGNILYIGNNKQLDMSNYSNGIYFINNRKIIKE